MSYDFNGGYLQGDFGAGTRGAPVFVAVYYRFPDPLPTAGSVFAAWGASSANQASSVNASVSYADPNYFARAGATNSGFTSGDASYLVPTPTTTLTDVWNAHFAVHESTTSRTVYFNSTSNTASVTTSIDVGTSLRYLRIGQNLNGSSAFDGKVAEVVVGLFTPTTQQITDYFSGVHATTVFSADSNWYYYPLNADGVLTDQSGNSGPTLVLSGTAAYDADHPAISGATTQLVPTTQALYYIGTRLDSKTNIRWKVTNGHDNLTGTILGAGIAGTTSDAGVFVPNGTIDSGETGAAVSDPVTLSLYWEEGNPAVDRSLIVKTTLVEAI